MSFHFVPSLAAVACVLAANCADGLEHVTLEHDGTEIQVSGRVEVEARDGGLLLLAADGVLWVVQPEQQRQRSSTDAEFQLLDRDGLDKSLLHELPAGFRVHDTAHYLICYNTSPAYAKWCGALYERLYDGFRNFWTRRGVTLHDPAAPLVAVLFDSKAAYIEYARHELGEAAESIPGYYSLRTNRITTYDLTGVEQFAPQRGRMATMARVNQVLAQPNARPTVATIVHEATHQLAFNCGLHRRYADIPVWVSEGIAMYFETPDLRSSTGWRGIGLNGSRLDQLRQYLQRRPPESLTTLLADDRRLQGSAEVSDAYAESWGFCHFLLQCYPAQFADYLRQLAQKEPLLYDQPEQRLEQFRNCLNVDLKQLDQEFLRFVLKLR